MKKIAVVSILAGGIALVVGFSIAGQEITINKKAGGVQKSVTIHQDSTGDSGSQSLTVNKSVEPVADPEPAPAPAPAASQGLTTTISSEPLETPQEQQEVNIISSAPAPQTSSVVVGTTGGEGSQTVTVQRNVEPLGVQKTVTIGGPAGNVVIEKNISGTGVQKSVTIGQGAVVIQKDAPAVQKSVIITSTDADAAGRAADAAGRAADAAGRAADAAGAEADRIADIIDGK